MVDAYEADKDLLESYGDVVTIKRHREDADDDEEPLARSDRGSKRRRARKEPESTSAPKEKASKTTGKSTEGSKPHHKSASQIYDESAEIELEYFFKEVYKATTEQLDWTNLEGQQYPYDLWKPLPLITNSCGRQVIPFDHFINNDLAYPGGGVSSRKLTNLKVEERLAFSVALRIFTRSIVIQRHVEDLQLGVESYQKKLNITKPNTYRSDLKQREAYTAYPSPRGYIYHNKEKKNRLMRLDELHKFNDGTLNDVRTALDDKLKGIRMECLPKKI
ncbi:hypothetical protein Tco_0561286 [Tanacetum coccineum]